MKTTTQITDKLDIVYVDINLLKPAEYNPRKHDKVAADHLKESIERFGAVDPLIVNQAPGRENIVIGGHFRLEVLKELGHKEVPVVYINISDIEREKELNIRLNKNTGEFDWNLLANFDEAFLAQVGFSSEELDDIFQIEDTPEQFDLEKELKKLNIAKITVQKQDVYQIGPHRLMCGDSTIADDMQKLMGNEKADMCFTDPPYILNYLKGKTRSKNGPT